MHGGERVAAASGQLRYEVRQRDGCALLNLFGELTVLTSLEINRLLGGLLWDRGLVVVDVSELAVGWPAGVGVFASASADAGGWPLARLVLLGVTPELAAALRTSRLDLAVLVATTWEEARTLLRVRPAHLTRDVPLPCTAFAGALARRAAGQACADWGLRGLAAAAKTVAAELAANAVQHARTAGTLTFSSLAGRGMRVSMRDWAPPPPGEPPFAGPPRRGLALVERLADAYGVTQHVDGKSVWAVLGTGRD